METDIVAINAVKELAGKQLVVWTKEDSPDWVVNEPHGDNWTHAYLYSGEIPQFIQERMSKVDMGFSYCGISPLGGGNVLAFINAYGFDPFQEAAHGN